MPAVRLYDERGNLLGNASQYKTIPEGNFRDYAIEPSDGNNRRPSYVQLLESEFVPSTSQDSLCQVNLALHLALWLLPSLHQMDLSLHSVM